MALDLYSIKKAPTWKRYLDTKDDHPAYLRGHSCCATHELHVVVADKNGRDKTNRDSNVDGQERLGDCRDVCFDDRTAKSFRHDSVNGGDRLSDDFERDVGSSGS